MEIICNCRHKNISTLYIFSSNIISSKEIRHILFCVDSSYINSIISKLENIIKNNIHLPEYIRRIHICINCINAIYKSNKELNKYALDIHNTEDNLSRETTPTMDDDIDRSCKIFYHNIVKIKKE